MVASRRSRMARAKAVLTFSHGSRGYNRAKSLFAYPRRKISETRSIKRSFIRYPFSFHFYGSYHWQKLMQIN